MDYIKFRVMNSEVNKLFCPLISCQRDISMKLLQSHLMEKDIYNKYLRFNRQNEINRNPDLKFCPTPNCEGFLTKPLTSSSSGFQKIVKCEVCLKETCFNCLHPSHPGETCDAKLDKDYEDWALPKAEVGTCKNCGVRIEKEGGCPNMTC